MTRQFGFTLLELLITVAIVSILAAIAYPSYQEYVRRSNRSEGQSFLLDAATRQERYFAQNNTYVTTQTKIAQLQLKNTTTTGSGNAATTTVSSETGKYQLVVSTVDGDGGFSLTANQQFGDAAGCGNLTFNAVGSKGRTGTGKSVSDCWR